MLYKRVFYMVTAGLIMISLAACTAASSTDEPTVVVAATSDETLPAPTNTAVASGTGACANPLYPVVQGATWTYTNTGGPTSEFSYTDTITEVRDDGFTLSTQFQELTRTQEWSCTSEGLVALTFGGGPSAGISTQGMTLDVTTSDITGVTLPASITPGMMWTYTLNFQGKMSISGTDQSAEATGQVSVDMQEMGTESVSVPAGTFDATKIQATSTLDITATFQGASVPVTVSGTSTLWYAPGIGLVKSEDTGDLGGTPIITTTELQSYNIP